MLATKKVSPNHKQKIESRFYDLKTEEDLVHSGILFVKTKEQAM